MRAITDYPAVRSLSGKVTAVLLTEAARLEAGQRGHFTTSLHDSEKRYLDVMAELFARGALPVLEGRPTCPADFLVIQRDHEAQIQRVTGLPPAA